MKSRILLGLIMIFAFSFMAFTSENDDSKNVASTENYYAPDIPDPQIIGTEVTGNCKMNIIFLAEGFKPSELSEFKDLCDQAKATILGIDPFSSYSNYINFWRVDSPSKTSGIKTKKFVAPACNGTTGMDTTSRTPWEVFDNRVGLEYYVGMESWRRDALEKLYGGYANNGYAYTIIITNTPNVWRGGAEFPNVDQYNTITNPKVSNMIVSRYDDGAYFDFLIRHEFGHSFGNMDDEYIDADSHCAITNYESWYLPPVPKANIKTVPTLGWYQGGRYVPTGYWRETFNSIMKEDYFATSYAPLQKQILADRLKKEIGCNPN